MDGFVLVNHIAGRVMGVTLWESDDQMRASREHADRILTKIGWRREPHVESWELVLDRNEVIARGHELRAEAEALAATE